MIKVYNFSLQNKLPSKAAFQVLVLKSSLSSEVTCAIGKAHRKPSLLLQPPEIKKDYCGSP